MFGELDLTVVDCGFEVRSCQAKYFKMSICCSFVYHLALRNKTHECLAGRIRYLHDVNFCVSEPAQWKLTRYVCLLQASSSFHQKATWDYPDVRRNLIWQSEKEDMKEKYKFLVGLRNKIGFGSEKKYLRTRNSFFFYFWLDQIGVHTQNLPQPRQAYQYYTTETIKNWNRHLTHLKHTILNLGQPVLRLVHWAQCFLLGRWAAKYTNFIGFCFTRPEFEPTIYLPHSRQADQS